jgi:hypothetical protein
MLIVTAVDAFQLYVIAISTSGVKKNKNNNNDVSAAIANVHVMAATPDVDNVDREANAVDGIKSSVSSLS